MSLEQFRTNFKQLHENWGYGFNTEPNYEDISHGTFRPFQHLTDFLMRYLYNGAGSEGDQKTMKDVVFYDPNREQMFNVTDAVLISYLKKCGPFFIDNRIACKGAYAYVKGCDPSSIRCLLQVALKWTAVVRKYVRRLRLGKAIKISDFTTRIKSDTLEEIDTYLDVEHGTGLKAAIKKYNEENEEKKYHVDLKADTVKGAILLMIQYYDSDTSASDTSDVSSEIDLVSSDGTSEIDLVSSDDEVVQVVDLTKSLKLRL